LRRELAAIGARMYARGFVAAADGNLSARAGRDRLLVTPAGSCLGELKPEEIVYVSGSGQVLSGRQRPTSELAMHLRVYARRPDVGAVIHAHPVHATALSVAGLTLSEPVLPELVLHLGSIPTTPYATLATEEGARAIDELIAAHDALILDRHGVLTAGCDLEAAFRALERLEHGARIVLAARRAGRVLTLPAEEAAKLEAMRRDIASGASSTTTPAVRPRR